ncbi:hypothetical protein OC861_001597 [Tilletia horrida]|nr:hypothetical protein OC861_001597 [Tilletia horrida]
MPLLAGVPLPTGVPAHQRACPAHQRAPAHQPACLPARPRPRPAVVDSGEDSGGEGASPAPAGPAIEAVRARPAGLDSALEELTFGLLKPLLGKGLFRSLQAPSGALLHGPPGTGKTMMAFHGLTANKIKFVYLKASDIHSKFTGVSERIIADAFDKAHLAAPAVLLIDELDCVFPARSSEAGSKHPSTLSQLLVELDNARAHRHRGPGPRPTTSSTPQDTRPAPQHGGEAVRPQMWVNVKVKKHHKISDSHFNTLARLTEGELASMVDEAIFRLAYKISTAVIPKGSRRPSKLPPLTIRHFKIPASSVSRERLFTKRGRRKHSR